MSLPERTSDPGWPKHLTDTDGYRYIRVRDGSEVDGIGHACQYVRETVDGYYDDYMYLPTLGSVEGDIHMSGGTFITPEECEAMGIPTVTLPGEDEDEDYDNP